MFLYNIHNSFEIAIIVKLKKILEVALTKLSNSNHNRKVNNEHFHEYLEKKDIRALGAAAARVHTSLCDFTFTHSNEHISNISNVRFFQHKTNHFFTLTILYSFRFFFGK